jgi:hypothetical protein
MGGNTDLVGLTVEALRPLNTMHRDFSGDSVRTSAHALRRDDGSSSDVLPTPGERRCGLRCCVWGRHGSSRPPVVRAGVYTSTAPAWNNTNLRRLSEKLKCVLALAHCLWALSAW